MTMYLKILVRTELRYFITVAVWPVSFKINFRTLYDFDLNEAIDVYDFIT